MRVDPQAYAITQLNKSAPKTKPGGPTFTIEPFANIKPILNGAYRIKGLLPSRGLACIYGAPSCGKSFVTITAALHIAAGYSFAGKSVRPGGVIYVAAEGGAGFRKRVAAARDHYGLPLDTPFGLITNRPNLGAEAGDTKSLIAAIGEQSTAHGIRPDVIVLDTLSRVSGAADINSPAGMAALVNNAAVIEHEFAALVILVHHSGKDSDRGMMGSQVLHGATECEWEIKHGAGGRTVRVAKMKDDQDDLVWSFDLKAVPVGTDEDGDEVRTCVIDITSEPAPGEPKTTGKPRGRPAELTLLFDCMTEALDDEGKRTRPFGSEGPEVLAVSPRQLLDRYRARAPAGDKPDTVRKRFDRQLASCADKGFVRKALVSGLEVVWMP